jgi:hypothetical protein
LILITIVSCDGVHEASFESVQTSWIIPELIPVDKERPLMVAAGSKTFEKTGVIPVVFAAIDH